MSWLPNSPEINTIEHLWFDIMTFAKLRQKRIVFVEWIWVLVMKHHLNQQFRTGLKNYIVGIRVSEWWISWNLTKNRCDPREYGCGATNDHFTNYCHVTDNENKSYLNISRCIQFYKIIWNLKNMCLLDTTEFNSSSKRRSCQEVQWKSQKIQIQCLKTYLYHCKRC